MTTKESFACMEKSLIAIEGLQNFGVCLALTAFLQEGIFIVQHAVTFVFPVLSEWQLPWFSWLLKQAKKDLTQIP